jgi:tetratricopeptide (TPR) repeat protein
MNFRYFLILFLFQMAQLVSAQNDSIFLKANDAYADENYAEALRLYKSIEKNDVESSELFYNMGNTAYKLELTAESIYYYEKALKLAPDDDAILNNLAYAERMRIDQFEASPETEINKSYKKILTFFSVDGWAYLTIALLVISCLSFAFFIFKRNTKSKRLFFSIFVVLLVGSLACFLLANSQLKLKANSTYAINFQDEKNLLEEPNPNATGLLQIHEGTKVKLLDEFRSFYKVELPNGTVGWLDKTNIRKI